MAEDAPKENGRSAAQRLLSWLGDAQPEAILLRVAFVLLLPALLVWGYWT